MAPAPLPCVFCPNPRTNKRGEHLWDDWLNRIGGKDIKDESTTNYYGFRGRFIRSHPSTRMDVTLALVCDRCNQGWMSDLSNSAKTLLEPTIRHNRPRDFDALDVVTITAFAFMKSALLDWQPIDIPRSPCISRSACLAFRHFLTSNSTTADIPLPDGLQVWIARYRRTYRMEAQAFCEEMKGARQFKGYRILVITYVVGSFIFQLTCPRWSKPTRKRISAPFFHMFGDTASVPIWPGVSAAYWPPLTYVDRSTLEGFRERFRRIRVPIS